MGWKDCYFLFIFIVVFANSREHRFPFLFASPPCNHRIAAGSASKKFAVEQVEAFAASNGLDEAELTSVLGVVTSGSLSE
jgi:hypothetical protein